ncbi:MAG TPA: transcriptional repressor [Polyangiaceae bacterium]|jgi:Fur family ferric uptake transcriptional regulator|nr:transcriptional repressor [Polyangiaceae bacterium]
MTSGESRKAQAGKPAKHPDVSRLRSQLDTYMAEQGLRSTGQRRAIIESFFSTAGHATIEDLLERVRQKDPGIGYATVYRTMKMLAAGGIAHEHKFSDGMTRYEIEDEDAHHDHLICVECGRIQEFEEPLIEELQARIAQRYGFTIVDHKHELYGLCSDSKCVARRKART